MNILAPASGRATAEMLAITCEAGEEESGFFHHFPDALSLRRETIGGGYRLHANLPPGIHPDRPRSLELRDAVQKIISRRQPHSYISIDNQRPTSLRAEKYSLTAQNTTYAFSTDLHLQSRPKSHLEFNGFSEVIDFFDDPSIKEVTSASVRLLGYSGVQAEVCLPTHVFKEYCSRNDIRPTDVGSLALANLDLDYGTVTLRTTTNMPLSTRGEVTTRAEVPRLSRRYSGRRQVT